MAPVRITAATIDDVPRILECAREFTAILPDCPLDESHYSQFWRGALQSRAGIILLLEEDDGRVVGGIGGMIHPDLLTGRLCAVELFWYVKREHRRGLWPVRLLKGFEVWARRRGCATVAMIYMQASMPERMKGFYEQAGYSLYECGYRKVLCPQSQE
jgi:GNAT superfamily N-acetyltransferase